MICRLQQLAVSATNLSRQFAPDGQVFGELELVNAAQSLGFRARVKRLDLNRVNQPMLPAIVCLENGDFALLARIQQDETGCQFLIQSPGQAPRLMPVEKLQQQCGGKLLLISKSRKWLKADNHFDIRWFIPCLLKYRRLFAEVLLASMLLQLFALATPLFFQVVMDKVLVHKGFTTLDVLAIGFFGIAVFDALLGGLRNYLFAHTTHRVDVELGAKLYHHLLGLPINWFAQRQTGHTVARVRELETIRNFITGSALTLVVDVFFAGLFLLLMWFYSKQLTLLVLAILPCYLLLALSITPMLRHRLEEKFRCGAENQAFLVESVSGMETIKSMAVEPQMQRRWEQQLADYVAATFNASNLSNIAGQLAGFFNKLMTLGIVWWGAHLVIAGQLSVGQLVAFNMLASRLSAPIMKLVQLWQDFQQAGISIKRLGDILNCPVETLPNSRQSMQSGIRGKIEFRKVSFRYQPGLPLKLENISFVIEPGQKIGLVGLSGSGKSTLLKLLQRLYTADSGRILFDDMDISSIDPAVLRQQLGMVQQENTLFSCSVRENIALANKAWPLDRVVEAAKLAGAHEFITELPQGYDTVLEEQGRNLSGGQRQRIAIARALVGKPPVLMFDEASSALDYESEFRLQQNMASICRGRTVIIIAHRLSTVRDCDRILVLENGRLIEQGSHEQLLEHQGRYARLYALQNKSPANDECFTAAEECKVS